MSTASSILRRATQARVRSMAVLLDFHKVASAHLGFGFGSSLSFVLLVTLLPLPILALVLLPLLLAATSSSSLRFSRFLFLGALLGCSLDRSIAMEPGTAAEAARAAERSLVDLPAGRPSLALTSRLRDRYWSNLRPGCQMRRLTSRVCCCNMLFTLMISMLF